MIDRSHFVASVSDVNPLENNKIERMGAIERIGQAISINPDLP